MGIVKVPLALSELAALAAEIHGSLYPDEILRCCQRTLALHFPVGRLSLLQHRANESTATLRSLEADGDAPLIGPKVIPLEESRLRECIMQEKEIAVHLADPSEQDGAEKEYLFCPATVAALYSPLILKGKLKGVLVVNLPEGELLKANEKSILDFVVGHLAQAIENSDIHYMERRRGRQLTMLGDIAKQAVMLEDLDEFLQSASILLREGFNYHAVEIWALASDQDQMQLRGFAYNAPLQEETDSQPPPMIEECRRQDRLLCENNVLESRGFPPVHEGTAGQLTVPVRLRGKFLAVLSVESNRLDAFQPEDLNIMEGVASLIASAFDNLRVFEHAQQSNEYMQAILDSAKDLAILSTDVNGYIITTSAGAQAVFKIPQREILGKDILTLFSNPRLQRELALYMSNRDLHTLERTRIPQGHGKTESYIDVTLQRVYDAKQRSIGSLCIARDVTENVRLHQSLEALSITDELTGLYNQRHFFSALSAEMERAARFRRRFSLCFFDLDGFKKFNDTYGHLRGDRVLRETARLLLSLVRANIDSCYRYGGDEFTVIMPETTARNAQTVADRMRIQLSDRFAGELSASIGIAECSGDLGAEDLIAKADRAMYEAKGKRGNCIVIAE